jgi:hypothetical protein
VVRIGDVIVLSSNTPDESICFLETPIHLLKWLARFFGSFDNIGALHFPCQLISLT